MAIKVKRQEITDEYCLYNGDSCEVIPNLPKESVGFTLYSPPFADLYSYSDNIEDLGNCKDYKLFFEHYKFIISGIYNTLMPGRITAVHCMDLPTYKRSGEEIGIKDFPGDIIRCHEQLGFIYHSRITIWKDPLIAATRTKAIGLAHKQIIKDSAICRTGIADYILAFRKPGENPKPIKHPRGLKIYHGKRPVPRDLGKYIVLQEQLHPDNLVEANPYEGGKDKRSHWIWQQYASPVWFDIDQTKVLPYRKARDKDDQKHICPLQIQTVERCMELWSTKGDVVLTPFMGVGTEVYVAVKNGRKGIGCELKESYFKQAVLNVKDANKAALEEQESFV